MAKAWKEKVTIPTYEVGKPEKAPMFPEKRVYQGSSGVVYPYPVIESISNEKQDMEYDAIYLENEYLKIMILPQLGGRVQMAYDKIARRHFIYYNHVIKPALVGLAGPWISGGIEFNWPQHHRPSTYMPIDSYIEEHNDGSVTVWVSEMERMSHQKGMAGFTLRPGHAYLEINGVVYNRTDMPQTFLWWANPAVAVNDYYQSVFPPDINAVFDHGKRAVSSFPIATGTYYKMDYSSGIDISNYKNIKVPTSYMAVNSKYDFEGGYENDTHCGMLHVANHHISPGKKQWTWGNGDFGQAWDRNLTDEDGPYIELMAGVYTENQPDFTWLMPYEEKSFVQYFMPYRELGIVKNASKDLLLNIEPCGESQVRFRIFATSCRQIRVTLHGAEGRTHYERIVTLGPEQVMEDEAGIGNDSFDRLNLVLSNPDTGQELLSWQPEPDTVKPLPDAAEAALQPEEIKTTEQLYLTGLHLEQYRHATYNPIDYYEEALRRDPSDVRNNNALGLWYLRRGQFSKAEDYLRTAVRVLMKRNPNPYDGEPLYNLALAMKYQGRYREAYDLFYKSTWNAAWQDAGYFACAQISTMQGHTEEALDEIDHCLIRNTHNHKARALKAILLCHQGRTDEARRHIEESLAIDPFNFGCLYEQCMLDHNTAPLTERMRDNAHNYDETALDFCAAGCWDEALELWDIAIRQNAVTPMTYYYTGWCMAQKGMNKNETDTAFRQAQDMNPDYCFPNRLEAILALQYATSHYADDSHAPYYLGCLYYDKRQYGLAMACWEESAGRNAGYPLVWRNLALAYFNKRKDENKAVEYMERAFGLDKNDARICMELDQLYKRLHYPHEKRLRFLCQYPDLITRRDDLMLEKATLLNLTGHYKEAKRIIDTHQFHPWEGGEGKVSGQYQMSRVELAKEAMAEGRMSEAISYLNECLTYPHNLGEGKLYGAQENDFYYLMGCAYDALNNREEAVRCWEKATLGPTEPAAALYYNDAQPDKIFYQGMALLKLGRKAEADGRFHKLINYGEKHLFDHVQMDYFAVSLPDLLIWDDDLDIRNKVHCKYMMALGHWGLGNREKARRFLTEAQASDNNHLGIYGTLTLFEQE